MESKIRKRCVRKASKTQKIFIVVKFYQKYMKSIKPVRKESFNEFYVLMMYKYARIILTFGSGLFEKWST